MIRPFRILAGLLILSLLLSACQAAGGSTQSAATAPAASTGYPAENPAAAYTSPQPNQASDAVPLVDGYPVLPGDENKAPGTFYVEKGEFRPNASNSAQTDLYIWGQLPTQCHEIRAYVNPPYENKLLVVRIYSVTDTGKVCTQALQPYEGVAATFKDIPAGTYTVLANEVTIGDITIP